MNRKKTNRKKVKTDKGDNKRLNEHIVHRICRLANAMIQVGANSIKEQWGLRPTDLRLLNILDGEEPLAVREISRRAHVDQAWVSRSIRDLETRDLVQRQNDPSDSRLTLISLTRHGRETLDEVRPYALKSEQFLLEGIDEQKFKAQLDKMELNTGSLLEAFENEPRSGRKSQENPE